MKPNEVWQAALGELQLQMTRQPVRPCLELFPVGHLLEFCVVVLTPSAIRHDDQHRGDHPDRRAGQQRGHDAVARAEALAPLAFETNPGPAVCRLERGVEGLTVSK